MKMANGVNNVSRYNWTMKNGPGEFRYLNKLVIEINTEDYQRASTYSKVLDIARNWSWVACNTIPIAHRDGHYWAVDGQHRVLAARKREDIIDLPCMIWEVSDVTDEAEAFLASNTNRKPISSFDRHRAEITSGDELAMLVEDVLRKHNIVVSKNAVKAKEFKCISAAKKMAAQDESRFDRVFETASRLCEQSGSYLSNILIWGLWDLERLTGKHLTDNNMAARLDKVGEISLCVEAKRSASLYVTGGANVWAQGMLNAINKGLRKKFGKTEDTYNG